MDVSSPCKKMRFRVPLHVWTYPKACMILTNRNFLMLIPKKNLYLCAGPLSIPFRGGCRLTVREHLGTACNHAEHQANDSGSLCLGWVIAPDGCCYHLTSRQVFRAPCLLSSGRHGRPLLSRWALVVVIVVLLLLVLVVVGAGLEEEG